jgi:hypothetical protein
MLLRTPEYQAAHRRVRKLWGRASQYPCVMCDHQAEQWAYDWADPSSREYYSDWPEFYMPLCRSCHVKFDQTGCYAVIKRIRRYTPGDNFVPYVPPSPAPRPAPIPKRPQTEAEWDRYLAART